MKAAVKKLEWMHYLFGLDKGHRCGECSHLESFRVGGKTVRKCKVYGESSSEATDWAGKWDACGLRNRSYTGAPVWTLKPRSRAQSRQQKAETPMDGQIEMED